MARSEILVTKPGALTCTEAMVMHLPMVLVNTLPGQERANAMHMKNLGCAEWVKRGELADSVRAILRDPLVRKKMADACSVAPSGSADQVAKVLYDLARKH